MSRYCPARLMGSVVQLLNGVFLVLWVLGDGYGFPIHARSIGSPLWWSGAAFLGVSIGIQIRLQRVIKGKRGCGCEAC